MKLKKHIFLIGFMGCGKSTVSRILADNYKADRIDTDDRIVEEEGRSIPAIFEEEGEEYFRQLETGLLTRLQMESPSIIACGGGMACRDNNIELMKKSGTVIMLTATAESIYQRVKHGKNRPLLNGNMNVRYIEELMEKRLPFYEKAADIKVSTDGYTPYEIARSIEQLIG